MDNERRNETVVSEWWTPDHLDVTFVPMTYARPKASWIDQAHQLRHVLNSDGADRMVRRRMHAHTIVDPHDVTSGPPIVTQPGAASRKAFEPLRWLPDLRPRSRAVTG